MYKAICVLIVFFNINLFSQNQLQPVTWTASYIDLPNGEGEITFKAKIDPKWHIYSQRPTDAGPIPTSFTILSNSNFETIGKVEETNAHEEYVAAFEAKIYILEGEAIFKQKIKRKNNAAFILQSTLEYMTCNDKQCLPPKTLELTVVAPLKK